MDLCEMGNTVRLSREAAATKLLALADTLAHHNSMEFQIAGKTITVNNPDDVQLGEDYELEIELAW